MTAITFKNAEDYEAQCERCTEYGIDKAGNMIWEVLKAETEEAWEKEEKMIRNDVDDYNIRRFNNELRVMLETYRKALMPIGVSLTIERSVLSEINHIHKVTATRRGYVVGCIAYW